MLKGIPSILNPELLKILMEMGHGDELLICDGNYPKFGCPERCVRLDGHGIPVILMAVLPDDPYKPEIWDEYRKIGKKYEKDGLREIAVQKTEFYPWGAKCYACIATSETALYANIILKKGVVK